MVRELPILNIKGTKYYIDERLNELREVGNPHNIIHVSDVELWNIISEAKDGNEEYDIVSLGREIDERLN